MENVLTYGLMGMFVLVFAAIVLVGCKYGEQKDMLFDLEDTTVLKGLWCIVVILVHIPAAYQNRIQDMIGSFAYIGVTFFFMTSAYGLKYGMSHKENYLKGFWLKRLPKLLVPALIVNAISVVVDCIGAGNTFTPISLIQINGWVEVLLLFYLAFWLVYYIPSKLNRRGGGTGKTLLSACLSLRVA